MYDPDTTLLIKQAPPLNGLENDEIPRMLTTAYAQIVAGRIRLRSGDLLANDDQLAELISSMERLAFTNEALVSARIDRENRKSAAFVAGSAHHVVLIAKQTTEATDSSLDALSISSEVAAALLFLIAEATADASEMAKHIKVPVKRNVESTLLECLKNLAEGKLVPITNARLPEEALIGSSAQEAAVQVLYLHLFNGVVVLARRLLGQGTEHDPEAFFDGTRRIASDDLGSIFGTRQGRLFSSFPGPRHLASLLSAVARNLMGSSLALVNPPPLANLATWKHLLDHIAGSRPFLWSNHRSAVNSGYLVPGVSAAISFPTGAGKSTLSELKIAAAIARGVKTVFLAPTLALVDQTVRSLAQSFPNEKIQAERANDLTLDLDVDLDDLPPISVMTPERCLAMMSFDPQIFSRIGLLVFDECHLLHPRNLEQCRRSIDAMLCLLNFVAYAANSDILLLSAMMQNADQMASWIQELTGRQCLPLTLDWKPTRQVRGCVVYDATKVQELRNLIRKTKSTSTTKGPPIGLQRQLRLPPYGFFSLSQTWASKARSNYSLLRLLNEEVALSINSTHWYLTPNGNQVGAALASASGTKGIKTLIFVQTIPLAVSAVDSTTGDDRRSVSLTDEEALLYDAALDELGDDSCLYLDVGGSRKLSAHAVCHHGDLLPAERNLHESIFRRADGVNVMVATSTLAQGMNLPSELVIISGDSRFDQEAGVMERLEAHELLNAAGRAGRAGNNSSGMVLVVPSKVTEFNNSANTIGGDWMELQAIFSQSDQCLEITDPFEALLDQIASNPSNASKNTKYFVSRLPIGSASDPDGVDGPAKLLLGKSLAAFKARQANQAAWFDSRINTLLAFRTGNSTTLTAYSWKDRLAASMAVPVEMVDYWEQAFRTPFSRVATVAQWASSVTAWLKGSAHLVPDALRLASLEALLGNEFKQLENERDRGQYVVSKLLPLLELWMAGEPLKELQSQLLPDAPLKKCSKGREFALHIVPDLAYLYSLPAAVFRAMIREEDLSTTVPLGLECLGPCVREGYDSVEKLAFRHFVRARGMNRRAIHREFVEWSTIIPDFEDGEELVDVIRRIEAISQLPDFSPEE